MFCKKKRGFLKSLIMVGLFIVGASFLIYGCASAPKTLDPALTSPQLIVNPDTISLGIAKLVSGTTIVFEGSGFKPKDDVFISLISENIDIPIANARVENNGNFTATVQDMAKITGILKATVTSKYAKDGKQSVIPVITQSPIPAGIYTAKATSMLSDNTAETKLIIKEASIIDSLKDWVGKKAGKIQDKRS